MIKGKIRYNETERGLGEQTITQSVHVWAKRQHVGPSFMPGPGQRPGKEKANRHNEDET